MSTAIATIVSVDPSSMLATVKVQNHFGQGTFTLKKVPIVFNDKSFISNTLQSGDKVVVEFVGSSLSSCKIIGLNYTNFNTIREEQRHSLQELNIDIKECEIKTKKHISDLLFSSKEKINDFSKSINIEDEYENIVNYDIGLYGNYDIGITHPFNKNTIKLYEDGTILISNGITNTIKLTNNGEITISGKNININSYNDINITAANNLNLTYKNKIEKKV